MGIQYANLDEATRRYMIAESALGGHYNSPRLTTAGAAQWVALFNRAVQTQNDDWLASELIRLGYLRTEEPYVRGGVTRTRQINQAHAAQMLAEGEFNRYYLRGLCARAANDNIDTLVIYRGKQVADPRPESQAKIGTHVDARALLEVLRANDFVSVDAAFAVPSGPNSGLTARLP